MPEFNPQAMDDAATDAENELSELAAKPELEAGINTIEDWTAKWFGKAGYKRLGRILVGNSKERGG
ncbi:hypothetical protein LCGC14_0393080 [marine sediment metagenome]|uniref:Uncharacterized protein n=1 Tax=marine sediment metagenome TaxID=412755 RepID=A0A0F9TH35_9ZZZZ